jgi:hypothetical protein
MLHTSYHLIRFLGSTPKRTAISTDSSNFAEATTFINAQHLQRIHSVFINFEAASCFFVNFAMSFF